MTVLHNRVSQVELKKRLYEETFSRTTFSFYKYFPISDPVAFRDEFYKLGESHGLFGRVYVAKEGVNAQLSIPQNNYQIFKQALQGIPVLRGIRLNVSVDNDGKSFWVLKVKVRDKIVADGI
ncbi:MAG: hypothetical protein ABIP80_02805, partial [Ferruginibacter sp.]